MELGWLWVGRNVDRVEVEEELAWPVNWSTWEGMELGVARRVTNRACLRLRPCLSLWPAPADCTLIAPAPAPSKLHLHSQLHLPSGAQSTPSLPLFTPTGKHQKPSQPHTPLRRLHTITFITSDIWSLHISASITPRPQNMATIMESAESEYAPKFAPFFGMVRCPSIPCHLRTRANHLSRPELPLLYVHRRSTYPPSHHHITDIHPTDDLWLSRSCLWHCEVWHWNRGCGNIPT